jgi:peptide/nickel transport system ATP-binding protein
MYLGRIVEIGAVDEVFGDPWHPYTHALLSAIPVPDPRVKRSRTRVLLRGNPPGPTGSSPGCRFVSRCPLHVALDAGQQNRCRNETPALAGGAGSDHRSACHFH